MDDSVGKCFRNEGIIVQWQSELHSEPSMLAFGAEQNSGNKDELSQQQVRYSMSWEMDFYCTYSILPTLE